MLEFQNYIFSILCAGILCGILSPLIQDDILKNMTHLLCGLVLTLVIIRPIGRLDLDKMNLPWEISLEDARYAVQSGEEMARDALTDIIKGKVEAYISDKAADLQAELISEVFLNEENVPVSVKLHGDVSPYVKNMLQTMIEKDLGITEENQLWIG